jgi:glycosyltransferase involved in cell wall biosynthesis
MRVALEALGLVPGQVGGMETYVRNLVTGLLEKSTPHEFLFLIGQEASGTFTPASRAREDFVADAAMPRCLGAYRYLQSAWQVAATARKLRSWRYDVLHCLMTLPKPPWGAKHMVLTMHDLNFDVLPELWKRITMRALCRVGTYVADKIVAVSDHEKYRIIERYGLHEERVEVIYPGIDTTLFSPGSNINPAVNTTDRFRLPRDFLFFPANTWPHKNHVGLVNALAILRDEHHLTPYLVLTGAEKDGHRAMLDAVTAFRLASQIRWLGYVTREELIALYQTTYALVFPSMYEGFGIPIIEAMASGCPVVCSKTTATGEVAGGAALTFDPKDPADIAASIARILTDEALRQELIRKGLKKVVDFSLNRMARDTLRIYEKVASRQ